MIAFVNLILKKMVMVVDYSRQCGQGLTYSLHVHNVVSLGVVCRLNLGQLLHREKLIIS